MLALARDIYVAVDPQSIHLPPPPRCDGRFTAQFTFQLSCGRQGWLSDEVQFGRGGITTSEIRPEKDETRVERGMRKNVGLATGQQNCESRTDGPANE